MRQTKVFVVLAAGLCLVLGASETAWANVFAADLSAPASWNSGGGPVTLQYRLNYAATSVTVEIYRASAPGTVIKTIAGTTNLGVNSVQWDGSKDGGGNADSASDYKFRVLASHSGFGSWTNITPLDGGNEIGSAQYYAPVGLAANKDQNSANFGHIYVSNGEAVSTSSEPGATAVGDGIFMLRNDMTFKGADAASSFIAIPDTNTAAGFTVSPWKININPDDSDEIVVSDFNDGYENVWVVQISTATVNKTLDKATSGPIPPASGPQNHGNTLSAWLQGTGANRKIWTIDEDFDTGAVSPAPASGDDILRYDIGTTLVDYTGAAFEVGNGAVNLGGVGINYSDRDLEIGYTSGALYVVNRRSNQGAAELAISRYTLDGTGKVNGAAWSLSNTTLTGLVGFTWNRTYSVAVDETRNLVAVGRDESSPAAAGGGQIALFNAATGAYVDTFHSGAAGNSYSFRDCEWDAAGNLLTSNQWDEHVRMFSPPGANNYTTSYRNVIDATIVSCGDVTPPGISSAVSSRVHGANGTYAITLPANSECRNGDATVIVTFDENVSGAGGLDASDISVNSSSGSPAVGSPSISGAQLTFTLTNMPTNAKITLGFPGIVDACDNACTATVCLKAIVGDAQNDDTTNIFDLVTMRNVLNQAASGSNFRSDANADGTINIFDLVVARNNLNSTITAVSCP